MLPDDVLLSIFDFYVVKYYDLTFIKFGVHYTKQSIESWQSLVHVCRRWRGLVFESSRRLNLQLCCSHNSSASISGPPPCLSGSSLRTVWIGQWMMSLQNSNLAIAYTKSTSISVQLGQLKNFGEKCRFHSRSLQFSAYHLTCHLKTTRRTTCLPVISPIRSWVDLHHVCDTSPYITLHFRDCRNYFCLRHSPRHSLAF